MYLEKSLVNYGLTKKQARTYLACLELGSSAVQRISQRAGLVRSTTYEVLESLRQKGLVSTFRKKNIKYFTAGEPQRIIEDMQSRTDLLKNDLPRLQALQYKTKNQPKVRFYQGKQGIKTVLNETLEAHELVGFSSVEDLFTSLENYFPKFVEKRIKKKIPLKVIMRDSPESRKRKTLGREQLREVRIIPSQYQHHGGMLLWNDKMAMFSLRDELTAVIIESKELSAIQKTLFNFIWNSAN